MPDDDIRFMRTGDERWTQQSTFEVRWSISQKGNPYLRAEVRGVDVALVVFRSQFKNTDQWTYSVRYAEQWMPSRRFFVDEECAKIAALDELARMRRAGTDEPEPPKREPVRDTPDDPNAPVRRIRL